MGIFTSRKKTILRPKTEIGPESSLKEFPLLYLYFDDFSELQNAARQGAFDVGMHRSYESHGDYRFEGILADEERFLEFYRNDMIRLKLRGGEFASLPDGNELYRKVEEEYLDILQNPEKHKRKPFSDPRLEALQQKDDKELDIILEALKLRYGK